MMKVNGCFVLECLENPCCFFCCLVSLVFVRFVRCVRFGLGEEKAMFLLSPWFPLFVLSIPVRYYIEDMHDANAVVLEVHGCFFGCCLVP